MNATREGGAPTGPFARLLDRLRCPDCHGALSSGGSVKDGLGCVRCRAAWPVVDGVALLAREGAAETWTTAPPAASSAAYQRRYREIDAATSYDEAYRRRPTKRWSTARERRLLRRLIGGLPEHRRRVDLLLDLPCGGGRLRSTLEPWAARLVEADVAVGQVAYARRRHDRDADPSVPDPAVYMTASAFHIPFCDEGVDAAVCCRLCHHLPTPAERERLVAELLRVSRRWVVMSFFDHHSLKNVVRRARRPLDGKPPKLTMTVRRVDALARRHGAVLVAAPPLSRLFSGHRYALMVKRTG